MKWDGMGWDGMVQLEETSNDHLVQLQSFQTCSIWSWELQQDKAVFSSEFTGVTRKTFQQRRHEIPGTGKDKLDISLTATALLRKSPKHRQ